MKLSNARLLMNDFARCSKFRTGQLGLEPAWGDATSGCANFKIVDGIEDLALFVSGWVTPSADNVDKQQPARICEESMISFSIDNVNEAFAALKVKSIIFINKPTDMSDWGIRTVYLRDPEENLVELFTPPSREQYSQELLEEDKKSQ